MSDKHKNERPAIGPPTSPRPDSDAGWRGFVRTQTWPVAFDLDGVRVHGNYCGTWGSGPIVDATDAACYQHDACYGAAGVSGVERLVDAGHLELSPDQRGAADACDEGLCEDLAKVEPETVREQASRALIAAFFTCGPSDRGRGGGGPER